MTLSAFFASGHAADLVVAVLAAEALWLTLVRRRDPFAVALALGPGACMLLSIRCALTGAAWWWVAAWLTASLPLHLADLRRRGWLTSGSSTRPPGSRASADP